MYKTIDKTPLGDIPWSSFTLKYNGARPSDNVPEWMNASFEVCYCDPRAVIHGILGHPGFKDDMDYVLYHEYDSKTERRHWQDFMSGDWAWMQADKIAKDPLTHGSTFVPVILGSDKTVVSVATGHTEYWPVYLSAGNVRNNLRRAHKGALAVIGFLSFPKTKKKYASSVEFRKFKHKLFHTSLAKILKLLLITVALCMALDLTLPTTRNKSSWHALSEAGAENNLDAGELLRSREHLNTLHEDTTPAIMWDQYGVVGDALPFTHYFPRSDIYETLAPDLLHQLIKGTFKDHLVLWVEKYLEKVHGTTRAQEIMDDIDKRISVVPPFSRLCRFPQGRGFEQWTGDDSKALMKVYLPAIEGHVPSEVHSMTHYSLLICLFGAPNESKHIEDMKLPWRRSNRYNALLQMLVTNQ
ncbi:hypothetical protein V8E53_009177 [Lactarius tabidus]